MYEFFCEKMNWFVAALVIAGIIFQFWRGSQEEIAFVHLWNEDTRTMAVCPDERVSKELKPCLDYYAGLGYGISNTYYRGQK